MRKKESDHIIEKVREAYDAIAPSFDSSRKVLWNEFSGFAELLKPGQKVLDVGCGNGRLIDAFKGKKIDYSGIDQSGELLKRARRHHPEAVFFEMDMQTLDFPDKTFDALFSIASFHHLPGLKKRKQAVAEMRRVLKKDGLLVLTVWNLFQWKYFWNFIKAIFLFSIHFGTKHAWNDLWIKWNDRRVMRYYHAFLPNELKRLFRSSDWAMEDFFFTRKGVRVQFLRSYNICLILRKKR